MLNAASPARAFLARWRHLQQEGPAGRKAITVAVTASFTVELLLPYLGVSLCQRGLFPRFRVAPFNQIYQALLNPSGPLREAADITLVLPRLEELAPAALARLRSLHPGEVAAARAEALAEVHRLEGALRSFAQEARGGMLLCANLPPPATTPLGVLDASHPASQRQLVAELNLALWQRAWRSRVRLFDLAAAVADHGMARSYDDRLFYLSRCPFSDGLLRHLGEQLCRAIAPLFLAPAKVLALDLDNTLWGGIIGEDGLAGIALGSSGPGAAFVAFQEALLDLRRQGVLLTLASKNNEADALEVFDRHPAMRLRREHLAAHRVGWGAKSESLRALAAELSLGLSSFVFIDDNPVECDEVRRLLPEVTVLQLPEDPAHYVSALRALPVLDRMLLTDEDLGRAEQYAAEQRRAALQAELAARPDGTEADPAALLSYLRSLDLRVEVRPLQAEDVTRAAQLTQKTNQFNLTTIRRSEAEVEALRSDPRWRLFGVEVADRFGAYGMTGLAFTQALAGDGSEHELDTMLLSCRVLGRGVETALLRVVAAVLRRAGARTLRGRFHATAKNAPAESFLSRHGFVLESRAEASLGGLVELDLYLDDSGAPRAGAPALGPAIDHIYISEGHFV